MLNGNSCVERVFWGGDALTTRQGGHPSTDEVGAVGYACATRSPGGHAFGTALISGVSTRESRSSVEGRWPMICRSHAARPRRCLARGMLAPREAGKEELEEWAGACRTSSVTWSTN